MPTEALLKISRDIARVLDLLTAPKASIDTVSDESKTHIFLSQIFKYISSLKVQFNVNLWSFHLDLCFAGN